MLDAILLFVAIACELAATGLLKASNGLTRFWPSVGVVVGYLIAFALLAHVLKRLPVGPVYATWAGVGTAGAAVVGWIAFGDHLSLGGWFGLGFIVVGVVLLGVFATPERGTPDSIKSEANPQQITGIPAGGS